MNSRLFKNGVIIILTAMLSGCALLFHGARYNPDLYTLNPVTITPSGYHSSATVLVLPPQPSGELITNKMIYIMRSHQINYFAKNTWAATPAQLLMPVIAQALSDSKAFHAVITPPYIGAATLRVDTQLLTLQQEFLTNPSRVRMVLNAQVIRISDGKVLAVQRFWAVVPTLGNDPYSGVVAANRATAMILQKLTRFVVSTSQTN